MVMDPLEDWSAELTLVSEEEKSDSKVEMVRSELDQINLKDSEEEKENCSICDKEVKGTWIECDECKLWMCLSCGGTPKNIEGEEITAMVKTEGFFWECKRCLTTRKERKKQEKAAKIMLEAEKERREDAEDTLKRRE